MQRAIWDPGHLWVAVPPNLIVDFEGGALKADSGIVLLLAATCLPWNWALQTYQWPFFGCPH